MYNNKYILTFMGKVRKRSWTIVRVRVRVCFTIIFTISVSYRVRFV